jgi:hypothetical protein
MRPWLLLSTTLALLVIAPAAQAAPMPLSVASPAESTLVVTGTDLRSGLSNESLTIKTSVSTVRVYRPDGSRASSNPPGALLTWTATEIVVRDAPVLAGTRVMRVSLGTMSKEASVQMTPLRMGVQAPSVDNQLMVTADAGLGPMPFVHALDSFGQWHVYANPRGVTMGDGEILSWTDRQILFSDPMLAGIGITRVIVSSSSDPLAAAIHAVDPPPGLIVQAPDPGPQPEIVSVESNAPCTATITGSLLADFDWINMEFDSLLLLEGAVYQAYLRAYQPGDSRNMSTTQVNVSETGGQSQITIYDPATCGKSMIVTSMLFDGGAAGTAWYETVQIQPLP